MANKNFEIKLKERTITFQLKDWADQANGNVVVQIGDTVILSAATLSKGREGLDFFPLTIEYEERFYAAGKILGSRFMRREGRASDDAIITARLIDRAVRPLFPKHMKGEIQIVNTCLSWDEENDADIIGLLGSSLALSISDIPWNGPVGVVRIGRIDNKFIVNPTYEEREKSEIDFVAAGTEKDGELVINMIEAESKEIGEDIYEQAWQYAEPFIKQLIALQRKIAAEVGKEKIIVEDSPVDAGLETEIKEYIGERLEKTLFENRLHEMNELKSELISYIEGKYPETEKEEYAAKFFEDEIDRMVNEGATKKNLRVDGRKMDEIRNLSGEVGLLPRTHGSALFTRGQTKTLSIVTLGTPGDYKLSENMEGLEKKRYMHHYNFPPYSSGETKPMRSPNRREIGHGMLAEKALLPVLPTTEEFPYTIRIVTESVASNGSTSMAAVCSSSLALMDAGIPITSPVAGIAMGIMTDEKGAYKILTDIQGPEDHHGGMDFKIAGTKKGITAIQMDVKILGITAPIFKEAMSGAKTARFKILDDLIEKVLPAPRKELSKWAPHIYTLKIDENKIGELIGPGGKNIKELIETFDVQIDVEEDGQIYVTAMNEENGKNAVEKIQGMMRTVEVGERFEGPVRRILDFGAFVEILPGQEGLVHISKLADKHVDKVEDIVNVGDVISVKVIKIDGQGRIDLSLKDAKK